MYWNFNTLYAMRNKKIKQAGFTLFELVVSIGIFSLVSVVTLAIFMQVLRIQKRSFGSQRVVENSLSAFENMSRDIRVSRICIAGSSCSASRLDINHPLKGAISFRYDSSAGKLVKTEAGTTVDITSSADVNFTRFQFRTIGLAVGDDQSSRVTITARVQPRSGAITVFDLQTSVTSRDIADEFQN